MKKITWLLTVFVLVFAFTSCNKEGKFSPKKKIDKIYYEQNNSNQGRTLSEMWHWNGKQLQSIDYYSNGALYSTNNFTYTKGRITRIDDYKNSEYVEFIYDGGKLSKCSRYYEGKLIDECVFKHKGNKIVSISETYFYYYKQENKDLKIVSNPLRFVLSESIVRVLDKNRAKAADSKGSQTYTTDIEWDKDNISKVKVVDGNVIEEGKYTYDKKNNPFYGMLDEYFDHSYFSKNNEISATFTDYYEGEVSTSVTNYTYTYDGNYPIVKHAVYDYESWTYYYEYLK